MGIPLRANQICSLCLQAHQLAEWQGGINGDVLVCTEIPHGSTVDGLNESTQQRLETPIIFFCSD